MLKIGDSIFDRNNEKFGLAVIIVYDFKRQKKER